MAFQVRTVLLIAIITIINYFDRSAISFAILPIEKELGLSDAEFGMILGAFGIGYLAISFISGIVLDRFGSIRIWAMSAAFWSCCTLSFSFARGFWSMLILRALLGAAEALHFPALLKTTADWLQPSFRARAISFGLLGVPIASVIGAPFLTFLMSGLSWRWMFVILGVLGLIWALIWPRCFRNRVNPHHGSGKERSATFWTMMKHRSFIASCIAYFALGYLVFFGLLWLPGFFEKQLHLSIHETGTLLMIPWGFSSLLIIAGGSISDWLWKITHSLRIARSYLIIIGLCLAGISFFFLIYASDLRVIIALLSLGLGFAFLINAPLYALNADLFPNRAATAQGIMTGFFALAGIIAPVITGFLVERSGSFVAPFFLIIFVCAIGAFAVFTLQNKIS